METTAKGEVRQIVISQKHTNEWLVQNNLERSDNQWSVAEDIVKNARELEGGIDWRYVLKDKTQTISYTSGERVWGTSAIAKSVATTVGSVSRQMGWDMHSPEIVYMSGAHFVFIMGRELDKLNQRIDSAEKGERKFIDDVSAEETLKREKEEVGMLGAFRKKLSDSFERYSRQVNLGDEEYLRILRSLTYLPHLGIKSDRYKIFQALREGDRSVAIAILAKYQPHLKS